MESLKDLEVQNPKAENPPASSSVDYVSVELSDKNDSHDSSQEIARPMEKESSLVEHTTDSKPKNISIALEESASLNNEPSTVTVNHSLSLKSKPSLIGGVQLPPLQDNTLSVTESSNTSGSARSDSSVSLQSSSDTDISHNTTATVTVVRNPAGHVMDGLMRRWDFNFFKNSNNR